MTLNIAVAGARRRRQGTGFYLGLACARLGHHVAAITTSNNDTLDEALRAFAEHELHPHGDTALENALAARPVDALIVATPVDAHEAALRTALAHRCHVLCEKPLVHPRPPGGAPADYRALLDDFAARALHLQLNTQWPYTLRYFNELYPELDLESDDIASFSMHLCPESDGAEMLVDAAPHFLSMLDALCGAGEMEQPRLDMHDGRLRLDFVFAHARGRTEAQLRLTRRKGQPKPAAYAVNNLEVGRRIIMPEYSLLLETPDGRRLAMRDPLAASVEDFTRKITDATPPGKTTQRTVSDGMKHLQTIVNLAHA